MKKFLTDLLMTSRKWSFKRVTSLYILNIAILYVFLPIFIPSFTVLEFVFWGFITYSASMVGITAYQKLKTPISVEPEPDKEPLTFEEKDE